MTIKTVVHRPGYLHAFTELEDSQRVLHVYACGIADVNNVMFEAVRRILNQHCHINHGSETIPDDDWFSGAVSVSSYTLYAYGTCPGGEHECRAEISRISA